MTVTTPWPSEAQLDAAYAGFYRPASGRFCGPGDALLRRSRMRLGRRLDALAPPGPILDVGSGDGTLLDALHAVGREAHGLERHAERADTRAVDIDQAGGPWAAIVMWHALEHLRAPGAALDTAARELLPLGIVAIAVPNASSLQARAFGERWLALDLPRHLTHIPARALRARLAASGLRIERESHWRGGQVMFGWLHGLVASLPGRPDLYEAIRRPEARSRPLCPAKRMAILALGTLLAPVAAVASVLEVALRRGGSVYIEARRA
ncbi:MAG TPA: class I SAM-dependent methyltransferase [Solirubrobacteraceae bacterium]|nr:class I SAM-dependent methyltransferase [Solirubrobacteraceae bacterium]